MFVRAGAVFSRERTRLFWVFTLLATGQLASRPSASLACVSSFSSLLLVSSLALLLPNACTTRERTTCSRVHVLCPSVCRHRRCDRLSRQASQLKRFEPSFSGLQSPSFLLQ